jgi:arabinose-5-phosphate isomerase
MNKTVSSPAPFDLLRQSLITEAEGIIQLSKNLDLHHVRAIEIIEKTKGRLILTGMGKSGHIANKIAATFASTGTPAYFVHPGEAIHGDLGMIAQDDTVIALSYSGNTQELLGIIEYTRRFRIPLLAITGNDNSVLATSADVVLLLPKVAEACPMGLAPTTSTTMMLALGDALAICLLERKGFSSQQFRNYHPGGALGKKLLKVADIMHRGEKMPLVPIDSHMDHAVLEMTSKGFGCVGIILSNGCLAGIITDGDLRRHMNKDLLSQPVKIIMSAKPRTIAPDALVASALAEMNINNRPITTLFVVEAQKPIGIIHVHDCLQAGIV